MDPRNMEELINSAWSKHPDTKHDNQCKHGCSNEKHPPNCQQKYIYHRSSCEINELFIQGKTSVRHFFVVLALQQNPAEMEMTCFLELSPSS
jgi:hypothetical protein